MTKIRSLRVWLPVTVLLAVAIGFAGWRLLREPEAVAPPEADEDDTGRNRTDVEHHMRVIGYVQ
jgi:hypothetical protein